MTQASVLIVDDELFARQTLSEWLRRKNFLVIEAGGGRQAIERIRKDEPDIVICDMVMPGMDGLQLLEKSKALRADIPFLMITGYPSHSAAVKALKRGGLGCLDRKQGFISGRLLRVHDHAAACFCGIVLK
jgi:DNA-binding NtrC family response regulator